MNELLPDIFINTKSDAQNFIKKLSDIANIKKDFCYTVYKKDNLIFNTHFLQIIPIKQNGHQEIGALLLPIEDKENIVRVEILADKWYIDPVTYDKYVDEAKRILLPLLSIYNKKYKVRKKLSIQSKKKLQIKLPKMANKLFMSFVISANKNMLHPLDWKRFYVFIRHCYSRKVKIYPFELKRLLLLNGFKEKNAEYLSDIFSHGLKLLGTYYY